MEAPNKDSLDRQESGYTPIQVPISTSDGSVIHCRTYQRQGHNDVSRPSRHYKDVIVRGAKQNNLPTPYIQQLERVQCNSYDGTVPIYDQIISKIKE